MNMTLVLPSVDIPTETDFGNLERVRSISVIDSNIEYLSNGRPTLVQIFSERELTFTFAIVDRPSVCLSSVVCNVRAPYSGY